MKLYRIGGKLVSEAKLFESVSAILADREGGATQEEAARTHSVQRSFVSFLETLGEIRRGQRIALVAFPVSNVDEVKELAARHSVDLVLVLSQSQREGVESASARDMFNMLLDSMAELASFDTIVLCASDKRIETFSRIFDSEVIGIPIGESPIREDVVVDLRELDAVLTGIQSAKRPSRSAKGRVGHALSKAGDLVRRWER